MFIKIPQGQFRKFFALIIVIIIATVHLFTFDKKIFHITFEKKLIKASQKNRKNHIFV